MTPPEPRPLVTVREARMLGHTTGWAEPIWVLRLACGHEVRRPSYRAPKRCRCDTCPKIGA